MATCKWCEKSGLFLKLSNNGLCNTCEMIIISEITKKAQHINESSEIIQKSSNTDTIISRFDSIVSILESLQKYEAKGITTLTPPPSKSLEKMSPEERDNHIVYGLEKELEKLKLELLELKTESGRVNKIRKVYTRLQEYRNQMINPKALEEVETAFEHLQEGSGNDIYPILGGLIGYFSLEAWWFKSFDKNEREYIETKVKDSLSLTKGDIDFSTQTKVDFLSSLLTWFRSKIDEPLAKKFRGKLEEIAENEPLEKTGYYRGRHYSSYAGEIEDLIRQDKLDEAEKLLFHCVDATEEEDRLEHFGVAPFFYNKLALIYRKQKDLNKEFSILERYSKQNFGNASSKGKILERLEKVKMLLAEGKQ